MNKLLDEYMDSDIFLMDYHNWFLMNYIKKE